VPVSKLVDVPQQEHFVHEKSHPKSM